MAARAVTARAAARAARTVVVACAIAATAHGESRPGYGGDVIGALLGEPATLDPINARTDAEVTLVGLVFDTLYRLDADNQIQPHLATTMPHADGGSVVIDVRTVDTHDGKTLGAADVAASLERVRTSAVGWILADVTAVRADGDRVLLDVAHAIPDLAARLAMPQTSITPGGAAVGAAPDGSGPFALVQLDRKKRKVVLKAFDGHFAGPPYVAQLELSWFTAADAEVRRFETGGAHFSLRGATTFTGHQPKYKSAVAEADASVLVFVGFGKAHPAVTGNKDLRAALSLALARNGFTTIGTGELVVPAGGPLPPSAGGVAATARDKNGDADAAAAAFAAAQAKVSELADGKLASLSLELLIDSSRPDDREVAERVVLALHKLGLETTITPVGAADLADRVAAGKCDLWIGQLAAASTVPDMLWAAAFDAGGDGWAKAELTKGPLDRTAAAKEFAARLPIVPLYHRAVRVSFRTDLKAIAVDAVGRLTLADAFFYGRPERAK